MLIAALGFSINPIIIKILSEYLSIPAILFFRFLIVILLFPLVVLLVSHHTFKSFFTITKTQLARLFMLSLLVVSNMYLFFASFAYISVNRAVFLFLAYPVFTLILAHFFIKEPVTRKDIFATALSFIGALVIFQNSGGFFGGSLIGDAMVILSTILWSAYIVLNRYTAAREMYWRQTFWTFIFIALLFFPIYLMYGNHESIISLPLSAIGLLLVTAVFSTIIPYAIINYVSRDLKTSTIGLLLLLNQVITILLSFWILKEEPTGNVIFGGMLLFAAALFSVYSLEQLFSPRNYLRIMRNAVRKFGSFKVVQIFYRKQ